MQQVEKQRGGNCEAHTTAQKVTPYKIDEVSGNLRGNDADSQSPSPKTAFEPTHSSGHEYGAEQ